ncbi:MAG: GNAT family N-acetyltransferase [Bdellovibrio sp.]|nr:GNAT family N-acetyltransferase [Bdellovibrio sp.]
MAAIPIEIKTIPGHEASAIVNPFYQSQSGKALARDTDLFFIAFKNTEVVGAVRFCEEENTSMLRSMMIREDQRRHGIGRLLLQEFQSYLNKNHIRDTYCLPYGHLGAFYGAIGFKTIDESFAPKFLQERLKEYRKKPESFLCMLRL